MSLNNFRISVETTVQNANQKFDEYVVHPIGKWLDQHELIKTIDIASKHVFRSIQMLGFVVLLPYSSMTNCIIGILWSISYRITIERKCDFHFAVVSCAGGYALGKALPSLAALIDGTAFISLKAFGQVIIGTTPLTLYLLAVVWISYAAVQAIKIQQQNNGQLQQTKVPSCCSGS
ncbi:MAG: hypothetical protein WC222_11775 [Parachlamydiales bacterium]|jgi:hypothetical protein